MRFDGPTDVAPGALATFHFVIESQAKATQTFAGLGVAARAGKLIAVAGQGEGVAANEVTHTTPKANDANGVASFEFMWQAPATAGTYTLFGAGNSVNRDVGSSGDRAAATTLRITVAAAATPTATSTATATKIPVTCVGDCDGSGTVTVDELITGVNIALNNLPAAACTAFDANGDGEVTINELLVGVNAALNMCPL